jgi:hypothetical protein
MECRQLEACQPIKLLDAARPEEMLKDVFDAEDAENSVEEGKLALTLSESF